MKVWVGCARGVQVAYVTPHHRGCTLVPPSTWAKRVPRGGGPSHFPFMKTAAKIQGRASLGAEPDSKNSGQGPSGGLTQHKNAV